MQAITERQIKIRTIELMKAHKKSSEILGLKNESYFNKQLESDPFARNGTNRIKK